MAFCKTVVLIDDDAIINLATENTITLNEFADQVIAFTTIKDALSFLSKAVNEEGILFPDIIFLDIHMPVQDGWDFIDAYREFPKTVKGKGRLYMLSSSIDESDILRSKQYQDVRDFIRKPLSKKDLEVIKFRRENEQ